MNNKAGVVTKTSAKEWYDDRAGRNVTLYSFQMQGERSWFRTGQREMVKEGQYVKFFSDDKGNAKDIEISEPPAGSKAPEASSSGGGGGQGRDGYWSAKEGRDLVRDERYQAVDVPRMSFAGAQDRAVRLVSAMLATDVLPVSTAKKANKYDIVLATVQEVTNRFFLENMHAHERLAHLEQLAVEAVSNMGQEEVSEDE